MYSLMFKFPFGEDVLDTDAMEFVRMKYSASSCRCGDWPHQSGGVQSSSRRWQLFLIVCSWPNIPCRRVHAMTRPGAERGGHEFLLHVLQVCGLSRVPCLKLGGQLPDEVNLDAVRFAYAMVVPLQFSEGKVSKRAARFTWRRRERCPVLRY